MELFATWLARQDHRADDVGRLAAVCRGDFTFPRQASLGAYCDHLRAREADPATLAALIVGYEEWRRSSRERIAA